MMTKDDAKRLGEGDRTLTAQGALLGTTTEDFFDPAYWAARDELVPATEGRGSTWFVAPRGSWVLRHYRRGGWMAHFSVDGYAWSGEERVRAFAEWRLLAALSSWGLPVPVPVAARYRRSGLIYRCDLITQRIAGARPLSAVLAQRALGKDDWHGVGAAVARLHAAGADHADLNAHNILMDDAATVSIIDFDRGTLRATGTWAAHNLARLRRSLLKISAGLPPDRFCATDWSALLAGYRR